MDHFHKKITLHLEKQVILYEQYSSLKLYNNMESRKRVKPPQSGVSSKLITSFFKTSKSINDTSQVIEPDLLLEEDKNEGSFFDYPTNK